MHTLKELNNEDLENTFGGVTFAYRVGQSIRFLGLATLQGAETAYYMSFFE